MAHVYVHFDGDHKIKVQGTLDSSRTSITNSMGGSGVWRAKTEDRDVLIVVDHIRAVVPHVEKDSSATLT